MEAMPAAFVSYSHDSPEHSRRVLDLTQALRSNGLDVELDQFHADEIVDWPRWCNEMTRPDRSDFVLCVATAEYARHIDGRVPPERGKGVYWEGSLLDDDLYDAKGNGRIIPVLLDEEPETSIPRFLRGWTFCRVREFEVADPGYEHLLRIVTGQARVVPKQVGQIPVLSAQTCEGETATGGRAVGEGLDVQNSELAATGLSTGKASTPPNLNSVRLSPAHPMAVARQIATSRLPHGAEVLVGREAELRRLTRALRSEKKHIVSVVAWGGGGKTALVGEWTGRLARDDWPGVQRYFDWSFYSQGTRDQSTASADMFIATALALFGDPDPQAGSPDERGERLARLVAERPTVLVLDGVEPLQHGPGPVAGQLKDPALRALLRGLAGRPMSGLCVLTTREPVTDLNRWHGKTVDEWQLEHLADRAGAELLHRSGAVHAGAAAIGPDDAELQSVSREVGGHALTLRLLGSYLGLAHKGDIRRRDVVRFDKADDETQGGHAFRVIAAYEAWLTAGEIEQEGRGFEQEVTEGTERETDRTEEDEVLGLAFWPEADEEEIPVRFLCYLLFKIFCDAVDSAAVGFVRQAGG